MMPKRLFDRSPVWGEQLFAQLNSHDGISCSDDSISEWDHLLACDLSDHSRKRKVIRLTPSRPRGKVTHLAVIAIIGHVKLWADEEDLTVEGEDSTVVQCRAVQDRPAERDMVSATAPCSESTSPHTHIPMSQMMPSVASVLRISASTSHECSTVSPSR